jgi:hypothetical protein
LRLGALAREAGRDTRGAEREQVLNLIVWLNHEFATVAEALRAEI